MNTRRFRELKGELESAIKTAPIFLCSTHGLYDLDKSPELYTVPPNTFIFEAQTIGDLTLTTIDEYIWNLLQGPYREAFWNYLLGDDGDAWFRREGVINNILYKRALSNLVLYKPGDTICKRNLSIGGGRTGDLAESKRHAYQDMGFFRFDPEDPTYEFRGYGSKQPCEILQRLDKELVEDPNRETTDVDLVYSILSGRPLTFLDGSTSGQTFGLAYKRNRVRGSPTIFVFSSCAAITDPRNSRHETNWEAIARIQHTAYLESMSMGLMGLGSSGAETTEEEVKTRMELRPKTLPQVFIPTFRVALPFSAPNAPYIHKVVEGYTSRGSTKKGGRRRRRHTTRRRTTRRR